jgi:cytoplasmic iron level regulating protein YaaA (DUF328/UPF0246 family)
MSALINHSYLDFFDIAVDAYNSQNQSIYRKLMTTIIGSYKELINEVEISNSYLDETQTLHYSQNELESFYENMYDSIDIIKIYKKHLENYKNKDGLFSDLYDVVDRLHTIMVEYLDRVSTLEVKEIQKSYAKAS